MREWVRRVAVALLVNGEYIPDRLFSEEFGRIGGDSRGLGQPESGELRRAAEERVINRTLLRQLAIQEGFRISAKELESERRQRWGSSSNTICGAGVSQALESELLAKKISDHLARHVLRPSRSEVEHFYRSNPGLFYRPERVQVAHVVKNCEGADSESAALAVLKAAEAKLKVGKPFGRVADQHSDCTGSGGALGWVARGEMVSEFEDVVFTLATGQRSGITSPWF